MEKLEKKDLKNGTLRIKLIKNGVVIDHIDQGKSLDVLRILGIDGNFSETVTLAMNVPSKILGKKDIVKVENRQLDPNEVNQIAIVAPSATINVIKDYEVIKKERVMLPDKIIGIIRCKNPQCITNKEREPAKSIFIVKQRSPLILTCSYCERDLV